MKCKISYFTVTFAPFFFAIKAGNGTVNYFSLIKLQHRSYNELNCCELFALLRWVNLLSSIRRFLVLFNSRIFCCCNKENSFLFCYLSNIKEMLEYFRDIFTLMTGIYSTYSSTHRNNFTRHFHIGSGRRFFF